MATKALLYSADKLSVEKTKESRCKALVRQLLAIEIGRRIYQYVLTHAADKVSTGRPEPKAESVRSGITRWEPPKHKRELKAHPWRDMVAQ